jgi:hypothetical protein
MSHWQRTARLTVILILAAMLGWPGLMMTADPASAAAARRPGVDCHITSRPSGAWVAVCHRTSSSTTTCGLIPLPRRPAGYLRRWPARFGHQWAVLDCPGPSPFGGVSLMPDSHR